MKSNQTKCGRGWKWMQKILVWGNKSTKAKGSIFSLGERRFYSHFFQGMYNNPNFSIMKCNVDTAECGCGGRWLGRKGWGVRTLHKPLFRIILNWRMLFHLRLVRVFSEYRWIKILIIFSQTQKFVIASAALNFFSFHTKLLINM